MKKPFEVGERKYECMQIGTRPYYISKCGEVISTTFGKPKVLVGGLSHGYRYLTLAADGPRELVRHHFLVMRYWVSPRPPGMVINHKNGIKTDNRLENLEYCTPTENREHAKAHRLYHSGSRCSWSKLNEETVALIKSAHTVGMSQNQLARAFQVSKKLIQLILAEKIWNK